MSRASGTFKDPYRSGDINSISSGTPIFKQPQCSASSVRLFRIVSLEFKSTTELKLETFPLASCPSFVAISYTWNPKPRNNEERKVYGTLHQNKWDTNPPEPLGKYLKRVKINGGSYKITLHLIGALWALKRYISRTSICAPSVVDIGKIPDPLWIFVDAICIKQDDPVDKQVQVANMHKIFSQAVRVFAWFGQGKYSQDDELGIGQRLPEIPRLIHGMKTLFSRLEHSEHATRYDLSTIAELQINNKALWKDLLRFNSPDIPYWERLWVVQEAVLAQELTILCGRYSLPCSVYMEFIRLCRNITMLYPNRISLDQVRKIDLIAANKRLHLIEEFTRLQPYDLTTRPPTGNLWDAKFQTFMILDTVRTSFASEPIDRVYAILALLGERVRARTFIDYSDLIKSVYWTKWIQVAGTVIRVMPSLAECFLTLAGYLARRDGMPSWCPSLYDNRNCHLSFSLFRSAGASQESAHPFRNPSPHAQDKWIYPIPNANALCAHGISFDKIARTFDFSWTYDALAEEHGTLGLNGSIPPEAAKRLLDCFFDCLIAIKDTGKETIDSEAILARCLVANTRISEDENSTAPEQALGYFRAYKKWLTYHYMRREAAGPRRIPKNQSLEDETPIYGASFQTFCISCAFFTTKSGRCGLTSWKVKPDDDLCLICNFGLPFVLRMRNLDKSYGVVGEAYVDGLADEKLLHRFTRYEVETKRFRIH